MKHNLVEAIIGAIVLIIAGFFFLTAYSTKQKNIADGYVLYAQFERVDGLNVGSDVKMSGVKVGIVSKLEINPKTYQARVALTLQPNIHLPQDSSAEITSESLLGGKYVALVPGGSEAFLKPNGEIIYTQSSVSFESLISKFLFSQSSDSKPTESKNETKMAGNPAR
jgi:phospholipid/cholesterol/gamma-HCH transport system substrate-binding protein